MHGSDEVRNSLGKQKQPSHHHSHYQRNNNAHSSPQHRSCCIAGRALIGTLLCMHYPAWGTNAGDHKLWPLPQGTHTGEENGAQQNAPVPLMLGSHRSGADSARILSTQPCIHKASQRMHPGLRGGNKAVTDERRLFVLGYCAALMRRSP